jgi:DNA-binding GntR family transcriptional regulator
MTEPIVELNSKDSGPANLATEAVRTRVEYSSLGNQVYELIWNRIITQQLRPGEKLSDTRLSKDLGVSRTPVREALHRLAQDGIVRTLSQRGFYLATYSSQDVNEIYDLRSALEMLAVRLATPRLGEAELEKAQQDLDWIKNLLAKNDEKAPELFLKVDREFHKMVSRAANNQRLATSLEGLQAQIGVFQLYGTHLIPLVKLSVEHHQRILSALIKRDRLAAEQAMQNHIEEVKTRVLAEFINPGKLTANLFQP